jgi:hypothetical protein
VKFVLLREASVKLAIVRSGKTIGSRSLGSLPAGAHTFLWTGLASNGAPVAAGTYSIVLTAVRSGLPDVQAACSAVVDLSHPAVTTTPASSVAKCSQTVATRYIVWDAQSTKACVTATVRTASGKVLQTVNCGWAPTAAPRLFSYTWRATGAYVVAFAAVDQGGNTQTTPTLWHVQITPVGVAYRTQATRSFRIRRGGLATLGYRVVATGAARGARALVTITVRNAAGHSVKTILLRNVPLNAAKSASFRCNLQRGTYRYYVYARFPGGGKQTTVGSARFVVF